MGSLNNSIDYYGSNITEDVTFIQDLEEIGLTELETVVLACLATVVPLLFIFGLGLLVKLCIDRCMKRKAERYQGYLTRDDSRLREADDEMRTSESQFSVIPPEEISEVVGEYGFGGGGGGGPSRPNGSIITINMKNNHLIVETEEPVPGILKPPSTLSPFSYATSSSSRNTLVSNTSGGTTYMVDIVEEQDNELDDLLEMNGPFMSNQEYYKYNKIKYEASQGGEGSMHIANVNTTCVELAHHGHEAVIDQCNSKSLRDFQVYEQKVEDNFKRNLSNSVDNEEVLSVEILDGQNEALNYQKILNDNQMFLKDITTSHSSHNARLKNNSQSKNCDRRTVATLSDDVRTVASPSCAIERYAGVGSYVNCACQPVISSNNFAVNPSVHIRQELGVNSSPGIYDYACSCKVRHGPSDSYDEDSLEVTVPDVVQHSNDLFISGQMSSQCILENYQNMYNDIRLGQVTSGFSQCETVSGENEYYRYGNQMEYYISDGRSKKPGLSEEVVHLELQKRLGNGLRTPSA